METPGARVVWVGPFPVSRNGISDYSLKITRAWPGMGVDMLRLYFSNWQRDYPLQTARVLGFLARTGIRRSRPLVHIQYCPYSTGPAAAVVAATARAFGMKVVTTVHEDRSSGLAAKSRVYRYVFPPFEEALFRLSNAFIAHCEAQRLRLPAVIQERTRIIEFGAERCTSLTDPDPVPTVGCFGIIAPHKGIETVIEACEKASHELPGLRLIIAGAVPHARRPEEYFEGVTRMARGLLGDRVDIHANVTDEAFDRLYHRVHALCFAVQRVNQSTTFYRALEHGKPVIATDVGGIGELVRREHLGRLVPVGNADRMAGALIELFRNEEARRSIEGAVSRYVAGRPWSRNSQEHLQLYQEVLGMNPEGRLDARAA